MPKSKYTIQGALFVLILWLLFLLKTIVREVLVSQQNGEGTEMSYVLAAFTFVETSPLPTSPTIVIHILQLMGLDKCIMTGIHHYGITPSIFTALKNTVFHLFIPHYWSSQPLATTDIFTVPIVLLSIQLVLTNTFKSMT